MDIVEEKDFPKEYPAEAVRVLNAMTFTDKASGLKIMGSSALRSQKYAGDYDGYEIVKGFSLNQLVKRFQEIVKHIKQMPSAYIGDIKCGEIEEWRVVPKTKKAFNLRSAEDKIDTLQKDKIISSEEAREAKASLKSYVIAKQDIKFQVVRWSPEEILAGHKKLRDGRTYTLEEGMSSPSLTKLDVISKVNGTYKEFSIIYEFYVNGKNINPFQIEPLQSLKESVEYYTLTKNPYKVLKRKFALAKLKNDLPAVEKYSKIINSPLGSLYLLYSDVKTLGDLLENSDFKPSLADFKSRIKDEGLPASLVSDLAKVKGKKGLGILRHIEKELLAHLSKGTRLRGGFHYVPFNG
jgi:hypothetical protein